MATITPRIFTRDTSADVDEEQLLRLFWNRAELKKELAALEREMIEVEEKSREKDAIMLRVQQRLSQLETMLGDPESAEAVITYYQLRGIWNFCHQSLAALASERSRKQRDRAYQQFIAAQEAERQQVIQQFDQQHAAIALEIDSVAASIRALRMQRHATRGIHRFLRRRKFASELAERRDYRKILNQQSAEISSARRLQVDAPLPEFDGIELRQKKNINLLLIAYAQELYLIFCDSDVASLAREASLREFHDVEYGGKRASRDIRSRINHLLRESHQDDGLVARAERRARYLESQVEYRNEKDCVPMATSLAALDVLDENGRRFNQININVLADEYWDLFGVLLR